MRIAAVLLCALVVASATAGEPTLRQAFEETAAAPPTLYVIGRDVLIAAGDAAYALANEYVDDADPGRRALAWWLRVRHDRPEQVAVWEKALASRHGLEVKRDATDIPRAIVRFPDIGSKGQWLGVREVLFYPMSEWVLVDAIRKGHGTDAMNAARIARVTEAAPAAPFIAATLERVWNPEEHAPYVDALVGIGDASLPHVQAALGSDKPGLVAAAATVVGQLADRASADALLDLVAMTDTDRVYRAVATALIAIAPERGAAAVLDRLLATTAIHARRDSQALAYDVARDAFLAFGRAAERAVALRRANGDAVEAAMLDGLAWELDDAERAAHAYRAIHAAYLETEPGLPYGLPGREESEDTAPHGRREFWWSRVRRGAPPELVRERAAAFGGAEDLVALIAAGAVRAPELARVALGGHLRRHRESALFAALVDHAPDVALDVLEASTTDDPPSALSSYVASTLLLLDHPRTAGILERIVARKPEGIRSWQDQVYVDAHGVAHAALGVARGTASMEDLLQDPAPGTALAAARALARRQDAKGILLLAEAAAKAHGHEYLPLRNDLVRSGVVPDRPEDDDVFRDVLRRAVAFRIAHAERAREIERAIQRHEPHVMNIRGPQPHHYETAGHALADELGPEARPLLEEAALFLANRISIHALGRLADDDSIPVLLRVARKAPGAASTALRAMGAKGIAAAREVPPPDPSKADFRGRGRRHVAAVDTLVGEDGGIEKVLEGLSEPPPEPGRGRHAWARRMAAYLGAGARLPQDSSEIPPPRPRGAPPEPRKLDARLLEPALALLAAHGRAEEGLRVSALHLLSHFEDERIAVAALPYLPSRRFDHDGGPALSALRGALGEGAIPFLLERVDGTRHDPRLHTLWRLVLMKDGTPAHRDACARLLRTACASDDAEAADQAATDLILLHTGRPEQERDEQDLRTVLDFVATHDWPRYVIYPLVDAKLPGTGEAVHAAYRRARSRVLLGALGTLRHAPAADDVHDEAIRRMAVDPKKERWRFQELKVLPKLGPRGVELTRPYLGEEHPPATRVAAAVALGDVGDAHSFPAILGLLLGMEAKAAKDEVTRKTWSVVLWAAAEADPERAHRAFVSRTLTAPRTLREAYAQAVATLRARHPSVRDALPTPEAGRPRR